MPDTDRITYGTTDGVVTVKAGDTVLAQSADAVVLRENGYPPRLYFPLHDVNMDILSASEKTTRCPFKGEAIYYHAETAAGIQRDIAWSYPTPIAEASDITGHIAFYEEKLSVDNAP